MTHGKTYNKSPRRINHKATKSKTNTGTTALERSVEQTTGGFKALLQLANFTHKAPFPISASKFFKLIFLLFLVAKHYKSSSVQSILSGLSYIHVLNGWPSPASHCLIKKILLGSKRVRQTSYGRLPITRKILRNIIKNISRLFVSVFEQTLFRAMYSLAFHAHLRVEEFTVTNTSAHAIQFKVLTFQVKGHTIISCNITLPL